MANDIELNVTQSSLEQLHCSVCKGYLSSPPICVLPDRSNVCGQCTTSNADALAYRVPILEVLLSNAIFPCIFKQYGCPTRVLFNHTVEHEAKCEYRPVPYATLNTQVKQEDTSIQGLDHQIKFEAPDIKFGIASGKDDIYTKRETLVSEELQIKDEIDQSATAGTIEMPTLHQYFYCYLCNSKFTRKSNLRQHITTHMGEKAFKCGVCDYSCIRNSNLSRHVKIHLEDKPFKCNVCDYRCTQKSHLSTHIKSHTGDKPFKCNICDYRCTQKSLLSRHIKTHTGEKPFKCCVCDYRCSQKSDLTKHIKTHTGEKPFECSVCDYRCTQQSGLSKHIKTHTGEKPFKCSTCDYRCIQKSHLLEHITTHTGDKPFKCSACDYRCSQKSLLSRHIKSHMRDKPF